MPTKFEYIRLRGPFPVIINVTDRLWLRYVITILALILAVTVILLIGVGIVLLFGWPFVLAGFWRSIREAMVSLWVRGFATAILAAVGVTLYAVRAFRQTLYGAAEILAGIAACWAGLGNPSASELSASLTVASGVYIIVRGLDNVKQGRAKDGTNGEKNKPNNSFNPTPR